jgi:hypothetical protein
LDDWHRKPLGHTSETTRNKGSQGMSQPGETGLSKKIWLAKVAPRANNGATLMPWLQQEPDMALKTKGRGDNGWAVGRLDPYVRPAA